jgi:hypothetical protein
VSADVALPAVATVGPHDRLVIRFDRDLDDTQRDHLRELLDRLGLTDRTLVLGGDVHVAVVTAEPAHDTAVPGTLTA